MSKDELITLLNEIISHNESVSEKLKAAVKASAETDFDTFSKNLMNASIESEIICNNMRKLLIMYSIVPKDVIMHQLGVMQGVDVINDADKIIITLPALPLKKRTYTNCNFITAPLFRCLEEYTRNYTVKKYRKCLITIRHIYPETISPRHIGDYDNIEIKKVLDVITLFFLIDDNMSLCDVLHTSGVGTDYRTEITLSPKS